MGIGKGTAARGVQRLTGKWLNVLNALDGNLLVPQADFFQCSIVLGGLQGTCRCIRLFCFPLPKSRNGSSCAVQPIPGFCQERTQLLPGGFRLGGALAGIHPGGGLGQVTALGFAHPAFQRPLHLGDLVPGVQPAAIGNIAGIQLGQAFVRVVAHGDTGVERVKVVAAVPAAQAGAGAVTSGGFKILVPLTVLHHSAAAVVDPALPHRMGGAGPLVGGHFHKFAAHLFHAGQL